VTSTGRVSSTTGISISRDSPVLADITVTVSIPLVNLLLTKHGTPLTKPHLLKMTGLQACPVSREARFGAKRRR
jgi:hypothetical protein